MQSFATQLLFRLFFKTKQGIKYLKSTVAHVIKSVLEMKEEQLEVGFCLWNFLKIFYQCSLACSKRRDGVSGGIKTELAICP